MQKALKEYIPPPIHHSDMLKAHSKNGCSLAVRSFVSKFLFQGFQQIYSIVFHCLNEVRAWTEHILQSSVAVHHAASVLVL